MSAALGGADGVGVVGLVGEKDAAWWTTGQQLPVHRRVTGLPSREGEVDGVAIDRSHIRKG